jgi:septal ring factor EnvC (AmiA/AmiB activator)
METVIASLIEKSVVAGAFVLLLWHFINTNAKQMDKFAEQLAKSNKALDNINKTLSGFDMRLQRLEEQNNKGE